MNQPRGYTVEDRGYLTPCWIHSGTLNHAGYGQVFGTTAHRRAWERAHGLVPVGLELDHLCRVRACVNLSHLELVTHAENCRRAAVARAGHVGGLRALRHAAGLSQRGLAEHLGVSQTMVSHWERGLFPIPGATLHVARRLAEAS